MAVVCLLTGDVHPLANCTKTSLQIMFTVDGKSKTVETNVSESQLQVSFGNTVLKGISISFVGNIFNVLTEAHH